ncbi:hypothetical protein SEA_ABBA_53 [Arthrobacter phage Abba]|uniref:Uncharacterized protein n=1 Tax=Arthrobacter phage Abba TaxID=2713256 RepID=A0A6G8R2G9_9CAUD|nr:hypothetical protein HYQ28_gp53 [Arthrobacter phage Abba]QIN94382.1 hypothetical protein SEA_ABBA_53 [Arthrobacter phage Abba]
MIELEAHLEHLLKADAGDRLALLRRVAALAWREGLDTGADLIDTDPDPVNPYSEKSHS